MGSLRLKREMIINRTNFCIVQGNCEGMSSARSESVEDLKYIAMII